MAVEHHAHVGDAGVHQVGQGEVHRPVPPAEGDGRRGADLSQLPQVVALFIGKDDAMQSVHRDTSSPLLFSMMPGRTCLSSSRTQPGASTVSPQGAGAVFSGVPPTRQPLPMRQPSPRMAYSTTAPGSTVTPGNSTE